MEFFEKMSKEKAINLNSLVLAFVGDAVHTLFVREKLVQTSDAKAGVLHTKMSGFVKASSQAKFVEQLYESFSEDEKDVYRRARNCKSHTMAKNATVEDYHKSTAFEAVIGYLYLTGNQERVIELLIKQGEN